ncbi:MAG: hypothetical protein GY906_30090 [bacterium]|nr:hypothetical protein [bacterium]
MTATAERIMFLRATPAINAGGLLVGDSGGISGGISSGSVAILYNKDEWQAVPGIMGNILRMQSNTEWGGQEGGGSFWAGTQNIEPAMMFPPFPPSPRIWRARNVTWLKVSQWDAGQPQTCRYFWGFFKKVSVNSPLSALDKGFGWIGFYAKSLGPTWGNWWVKVCDDAEVLLHDVDTGISAHETLISMRIDIDGSEQEMRFYLNEGLVSTYAPASGVLGGTEPQQQRLGSFLNVGFETGAPVRCIAERLGQVLCWFDSFLTEVQVEEDD